MMEMIKKDIIQRCPHGSSYIINNCCILSALTSQVIQPTVQQSGVGVQVRTGPPGAGFGLMLQQGGQMSTWSPCILLKKRTSPLTLHLVTRTHGFTNSRFTEELILIGSDRRRIWAQRWSPSQPRLMSQESGGLPARLKPTVTHIPPSSLC